MADPEFLYTKCALHPAALDNLRKEAFPGPYPSGTSLDEFDLHARHRCIVAEGDVVGYQRLTEGPGSVVTSWTRGLADVPDGPGIGSLSRCSLSQRVRGLGLYRTMVILAVLEARQAGWAGLIGSVLDGDRSLSMFMDVGFRLAGPVVPETEPAGIRFSIQPIYINLDPIDDSSIRRLLTESTNKMTQALRVEVADICMVARA